MSNISQNKGSETRPPVVVILGHVDHGKTKLLDTIRNANVIDTESGGITQHIGAYQVDWQGKKITFLDTPGHEAFAAIRSRGVKVADVAVLVVAADEGVKPQTKEAIKIIKESETPCIVAINKIDKEAANTQKVRQDLASEEILVEDWGGKVPVVEISAKENRNINELLDMILLVAEMEELKMNLDGPTEGVIIESHLDKRRGYIATALVRTGIIRPGEWIVAGTAMGKIKSIEDYNGVQIESGIPSQPVIITGWSSAPQIGKPFQIAKDKDEATDIKLANTNIKQLLFFIAGSSKNNENKKVLNVIFKTDVSSSMEALDNMLSQITSEEVGYNVVNYDIGNITETDVKVAMAGNAQIIGFRVSADKAAEKLAERDNIKIATFDIIYELIEYFREEVTSLLGSDIKKNVIGKMKVLAIFKTDTKSMIIGGKVFSGRVLRGVACDVLKNGEIVGSAKIGQLQHNKEDVTEVNEGLDAGLRLDFKSASEMPEIKEGDIIEIYEEEKVKRTL